MNGHEINQLSFLRFDATPEAPALLGTAGSRRTVYLGEENKPNEEPSTSNGNGNGKSESPNTTGSAGAPTFLMYNKISTTITGKDSPTSSTSNGNENQKSKSDKKKNDQKNRESAIWYEYGCV